jgi:hypothetical protein
MRMETVVGRVGLARQTTPPSTFQSAGIRKRNASIPNCGSWTSNGFNRTPPTCCPLQAAKIPASRSSRLKIDWTSNESGIWENLAFGCPGLMA